jgi:hypothetical protein
METKTNYLSGSFKDRKSAEHAYDKLKEKGYTDKEIDIMMSKATHEKYFKKNEDEGLGSKVMEGVGAGSAVGGVVGAVVGILAAVGTSLVIPGLGLVLAGPIALGLAGAGAGGVSGGVLGALVGAGMPKDRAEKHEKNIREGNIVVGVTPRSSADHSSIGNDWTMYDASEVY